MYHFDAENFDIMPKINIKWASDRSVLIEIGKELSLENSQKVWEIAAAIKNHKNLHIASVRPAYASVLVESKRGILSHHHFFAELTKLVNAAVEESKEQESKFTSKKSIIEIPVKYDEKNGLDLGEVSELTGLSKDEIVRRHTTRIYEVAFLGFSPGFPYLLGLDPVLNIPRREFPRDRIPAGSVAVANGQAGIYTQATPGGWRIIGRTDVLLFDPIRAKPNLLEAGDRVKFVVEAGAE